MNLEKNIEQKLFFTASLLCNNCHRMREHIKLKDKDEWFRNFINEYWVCTHCGTKKLVFREIEDAEEETNTTDDNENDEG